MTHIRYYILLLLTLLSTLAWAEGEEESASTPNVIIGGNVYGGGRRGAILEKKELTDANGDPILDDNGDPKIIVGGEDAGHTNVRIYDGVIGNEETVERGMGNVFGAGFGARANVRFTSVKMYGGTVKNSLYGGGEIAAVGKGVTREPIDKVPIFEKVIQQGGTTVELYKGHVERDVFGGGRGYTEASDDGTMALDRLYTDGYVFGSTKVRIYGGEVGTSEGVAKGYGNVFGGGNVGFVYSGNIPIKGNTPGIQVSFLDPDETYYVIPTNAELNEQYGLTGDEYDAFFAKEEDKNNRGHLSIACDVRIEPQCQVKDGKSLTITRGSGVSEETKTFNEGEYIPFDWLDHLEYDKENEATIDAWSENLNEDGVVIHNAVFAGGNVSTGDSQVFAETTTVFGNVAATVNDLYIRDLITIGTEHTGGLYGDGNLTFVDGYRELNITNYGTDYYSLDDRIEMDVYNGLNTREKAYFQVEYECTESYTSTVKKKSDNITFVTFAVGDRLLQDDYDKEIASDPDLVNKWKQAGFCSIYAGRLLNTIQRADFVGMFGSRLVLQGAEDRVINKDQDGNYLNFAEVYTLNRIGELSLNKERKPELGDSYDSDDPEDPLYESANDYRNYHGNYFGIYSNVHYLGALTSDVRFDEDIRWIEEGEGNAKTRKTEFDLDPEDEDPSENEYTYLEWKKQKFGSSKEKNRGQSDNIMALASGVFLELKQENDDKWGPITGVVQLELINVTTGEGGGFVYARNEHGTASRRHEVENDDSSPKYYRTFLSEDNYQAATHEEYTYTLEDVYDIKKINNSGNFITVSKPGEPKRYIVDDCYPNHNNFTSNDENEAHYWYIRGEIYSYNQTISAYTGAADKFESSLRIPFAMGGNVSGAKIQLKAIYPGRYCTIAEDADPVVVGENQYRRNDPISYWEWQKAGADVKDYFEVDSIYNSIYAAANNGANLNNMSHGTGYVLTLEFKQIDNEGNPIEDDYGNPLEELNYYSPEETNSPSYSPKSTGPYGQHYYDEGTIIPKIVVDEYNKPETFPEGVRESLEDQAEVELVDDYWLCIRSLQLNDGGQYLLTKGDLIPTEEGSTNPDIDAIIDQYISITLNIPVDQLTDADRHTSPRAGYVDLYDEAKQVIENSLTRCYRVKEDKAGWYGGSYYDATKKYDALQGWCSLIDDDRENWKFNGDALDLLYPYEKYFDQQTIGSLSAVPTEVATLYVSSESNLADLRKEKYITAYFEYSYIEDEEETVEQHYINIKIEFKDELPYVGEIEDPGLVLPGTVRSFKTPDIIRGALGVSGGEWVIYDNKVDANSHINGKKYDNRTEPFYWYEDGYWVDYYAITMAGKQYSQGPVQIKVANYHDLKRVMEDPDYLGIGMRKPETSEAQRSPKVYINDYSGESGLDLLKDLYERTLDDDDILKSKVEGCKDLEIILRSDLEPGDPWTSIGSGTGEPCFQGNLHGDGYTISGLTSSLFKSLCGNVYNLGVTGEFPSGSSGIADVNNGRIENCWVYDTSDSPDATTKPIANDGLIANSYYNEDKFTTTSPTDGAIGKDERAFYNGEIAYELNGYYLKKGGKASSTEGSLDDLSLSNEEPVQDYVQDRYTDGDFVYAGGELLPQNEDKHYWEEHDPNDDFGWDALYPDDYIFFGQSLTYGHGNVTHQDLPGRIGEVDGESNRVYRAPAYFQNATPNKAYYNDNAVFAAQSADGSHDVYPHMTAIDFTGYTSDGTPSTILDHAPLKSFLNADLTQNLLVYAGASDKTVIRSYLDSKEPIYEETTATGSTGDYRSVEDVNPTVINKIKGHAVYLNGTGYQAESDHFLVDRQEFFAPIEYSFISVPTLSDPESQRATRMWYQRQPDNYVVINEGWEVVSLPFTAELVTTQTKGEITHFYEEKNRHTETDDPDSDDPVDHPLDDHLKSHEYWLREYQKGVEATGDANVSVAVFNYPDEVTGGGAKTATNTFLWDYYYSKESRQDMHSDIYQQYYKESREYAGYPYLTAGTPYLIGFPGSKYYEFDLTGDFLPLTSMGKINRTIDKLDKQVITFASEENGTIPVSSEKAVVGEGTGAGYNFVPCLVETEHEANSDYVLNATGSSFDKITSSGELTVLTVPFRPFFTSTSRYNSRTRSLLFGYGDKEETHEAEPREADEPGQLIIRSGQHRIIVSSSLSESTTVRIVNVSGITLHTFDIAPGETIEKFIPNQGVYIVQTINGRYTKKLAVK